MVTCVKCNGEYMAGPTFDNVLCISHRQWFLGALRAAVKYDDCVQVFCRSRVFNQLESIHVDPESGDAVSMHACSVCRQARRGEEARSVRAGGKIILGSREFNRPGVEPYRIGHRILSIGPWALAIWQYMNHTESCFTALQLGCLLGE